MPHRYCMEAVDRTLQDVLDCNRPCGGIVVLWGGIQVDSPSGWERQQRRYWSACIQHSYLWCMCRSSIWLKTCGLGTVQRNRPLLLLVRGPIQQHGGGVYYVPFWSCENWWRDCRGRLGESFHATYPGVSNPQSPRYFTERTILTTRRNSGWAQPHYSCQVLWGDPHLCRLWQGCPWNPRTLCWGFVCRLYSWVPAEPDTKWLSKGQMALKVGCPVMLLRNLDTSQGLCHGTRLLITRASTCPWGSHFGRWTWQKPVFIPRITLYSHKSDLTFILLHAINSQFAMTINKSQGQSVKHVGLTCIHLSLHMANSMLRSQGPLLKICSMFY